MNARIFKILAERENYKRGEQLNAYDKEYGIIKIDDLANDFFNFIYPYFSKEESIKEGNVDYREAPFTITPAGKNFDSFDRNFIKLVPKWDRYVRLRSRTIDPTSMYIDWQNDDAPPGLGECLKRAGVPKKISHKAVEDCLDTLLVIRKNYENNKTWMK